MLSGNSGVEFILRSRKLLPWTKPWGYCNQAAGCVSLGKGGGARPFLDECKIPDGPPNCWNELKTLQCWKQTHERQKILTRQFLLIKRVQACTHCSWSDMWVQNGWQWLLLISWRGCACFLPGICPGQRFTIFLNWLKGLGDGLGHVIWWAIFMGNGTVQESGRNRNPLNNASHLRWRSKEF
jgi:hypothetical protein